LVGVEGLAVAGGLGEGGGGGIGVVVEHLVDGLGVGVALLDTPAAGVPVLGGTALLGAHAQAQVGPAEGEVNLGQAGLRELVNAERAGDFHRQTR
jgi:hypothetical protein